MRDLQNLEQLVMTFSIQTLSGRRCYLRNKALSCDSVVPNRHILRYLRERRELGYLFVQDVEPRTPLFNSKEKLGGRGMDGIADESLAWEEVRSHDYQVGKLLKFLLASFAFYEGTSISPGSDDASPRMQVILFFLILHPLVFPST